MKTKISKSVCKSIFAFLCLATISLSAGEGYFVFPQPDGTSSGSYTQTHTLRTLKNGAENFPLTCNTPGPTASDNQNTSPNILANSDASASLDRIWINVYNDTYSLGSTALIGFSEDFSDAYVNSEDVFRLATPVSIYSELESGEQLAINALHTFEVEDSFYLGFSTQVQEMQDYRISIQDIDGLNLENATIYLMDTLNGTIINLKEGDYTFQSEEAAYLNRFKVVFMLTTVTFTAPADLDLCTDATVQTGLGGGLPTGGIYSGPGVTDDGNGSTYSYDPIAAGTGVHTLMYTVTSGGGSASDDIEVLGTIKTWNGTSWLTPGLPDLGTSVVIDGDFQAGVLNDGNLDVCTIIINTGATLSIPATGFIRVNGSIIVDGSLLVEHEGSVVQVDDAAMAINNGTINVAKTTPFMTAKSFLILGSPMDIETREGVYASSYIVRNHNTLDFVPNGDVATMFPSAINFADDNGDNWVNHTGLLSAGKGFLVFPQPDGTSSGNYTHNYTQGTLNNGVVTQSLIFNGTQNASPNILSNPYASAIDTDLFFDDPANADINVLYFWDHITPLSPYPGYSPLNFHMGDISRYSEILGGSPAANGIVAPSNIMSSGQGFGVRAASAGITATFNNAMRVTGPNDTYRTPEPITRNRLWVRVYNETYSLGSVALIGFTDVSTDGFNKREDDGRIATPVSLYSEVATGEELGINAMGPFEISDAITLGFSTMVKELIDYRISILDIDGADFENVTVYLIDADNGSVTNLTEGDYVFQSREATHSSRFKIVFENTLGTGDVDLESISLYPNPAESLVTIVSPRTILEGATVFDIAGRKVSEVNFRNQTNYQIDLSELEVAIYFIAIATENGTVTKGVMKK